jgi:type I restriction enzyme S subunit
MGNFTNYSLPLPPKSTQLAIVSKIEELFSELDKGIEQLKTAQQQLKTYRQSVLKWAFEGKLANSLNNDSFDLGDEHDLSIAAEPEVEYNVKKNQGNQNDHINHSSDKGELPKGWKTVILKDVCKIVGGVTKGRDFKGKGTIRLPYLRVANVQDGYLDLDEIKTIEVLPSDKEKYKLLFGDILYTEGGDKDKLGRGTIWKNEIEDCIHQNHIFRARPLSKEVDSKYIAYFSQTKSAKNYFFKHGKQTTNLASINLTILSNLSLPICAINEQKDIVQEIESRLSVADKIEESINQSLQQAEVLKQSILKKAFEGKLI